ncbi:MAG: hypothetical protein ACREC0_06890 [Methylocella sp.]
MGKIGRVEVQRIGAEEIPYMVKRHKEDDEPAHPVDRRQPEALRGNARARFDGMGFDMVHRLGQPTPSLDWEHHPATISYPFAARKAAQTRYSACNFGSDANLMTVWQLGHRDVWRLERLTAPSSCRSRDYGGVMHKNVFHNKSYAKFKDSWCAVLNFPRDEAPKNRHLNCDSDTARPQHAMSIRI